MPKLPKKKTMLEVVDRCWGYVVKLYRAGKITDAQANSFQKNLAKLANTIRDKI